MIEAWLMQRYVRIFLTGGVLAASFALAELFLLQNNLSLAILPYSISLATLIGAGKLASP